MKIVDCIQGTEEWRMARCGIPTASEFDKIITTEGKRSKSREKYLCQLAGETVLGRPVNGYKNENMENGNILEEEARNAYEFITGNEVNLVGLCLTEGDFICGASPDSLVGKDGGLEIKCPTLAVHVSYLLDNKLPTDYFQQVQGQLFVTGREWVDFVSYYPGIKPLIVRVKPDTKFILSLQMELEAFCKDLKMMIEKIRG